MTSSSSERVMPNASGAPSHAVNRHGKTRTNTDHIVLKPTPGAERQRRALGAWTATEKHRRTRKKILKPTPGAESHRRALPAVDGHGKTSKNTDHIVVKQRV